MQPEPPPPPSGRAVPAALLVVRIGPGDVGARVTVRHRYDATTLTDVVGDLLSWDEAAGTLEVRRRDGSVARIAVADLVAAKVVPPRPPRPPVGPPGAS